MKFNKSKFQVTMQERIVETECYLVDAPKWKPLKLCVHKELDCAGMPGKKWVMSEVETGFKVSQFAWPSRDKAVEDGMARLANAGKEQVEEVMTKARERRAVVERLMSKRGKGVD